MNRNLNEFTDFESLELEVPMFCVVTGCVSARRDRRYRESGSRCEAGFEGHCTRSALGQPKMSITGDRGFEVFSRGWMEPVPMPADLLANPQNLVYTATPGRDVS
jgi:hypothetical protein